MAIKGARVSRGPIAHLSRLIEKHLLETSREVPLSHSVSSTESSLFVPMSAAHARTCSSNLRTELDLERRHFSGRNLANALHKMGWRVLVSPRTEGVQGVHVRIQGVNLDHAGQPERQQTPLELEQLPPQLWVTETWLRNRRDQRRFVQGIFEKYDEAHTQRIVDRGN